MALVTVDLDATIAFYEGVLGMRMTPFGDVGAIRNTLFLDNNGMLLEATWWPK